MLGGSRHNNYGHIEKPNHAYVYAPVYKAPMALARMLKTYGGPKYYLTKFIKSIFWLHHPLAVTYRIGPVPRWVRVFLCLETSSNESSLFLY